MTTAHSWETLVIFALNFKELNVHMNMGNVMGNVDWISRNFKSEGRLSIGSTGHKNMFITLALTSYKLEAKAGIVGGNLILVYSINFTKFFTKLIYICNNFTKKKSVIFKKYRCH